MPETGIESLCKLEMHLMQAYPSTFVDEKLYRFALFMSFIRHHSDPHSIGL